MNRQRIRCVSGAKHHQNDNGPRPNIVINVINQNPKPESAAPPPYSYLPATPRRPIPQPRKPQIKISYSNQNVPPPPSPQINITYHGDYIPPPPTPSYQYVAPPPSPHITIKYPGDNMPPPPSVKMPPPPPGSWAPNSIPPAPIAGVRKFEKVPEPCFHTGIMYNCDYCTTYRK